MPKRDAIEEALACLLALRGKPVTSEARKQLAAALRSKVNLVAAKAAQIAGEMRLDDLTPELEAAFKRFMVNGASTDKQCAAKLAIANALYEMDAASQEIFLAGAGHRQMEPVWGGQADSAVELRGRCAMGLVKTRYRDVMLILVDHLADPSPQGRINAARTIAGTGRDEGVLLLRLKILSGDKSSDVVGECLIALMALAAKQSLQFTARFLDSRDETIAQSAAQALGQSHLPEALEIICRQVEKSPTLARQALLLPIAMTRLTEAVTFLIDHAGRMPGDAMAVIRAMEMYRHDEAIAGQLREIVERDGRGELKEEFARIFGNRPDIPKAKRDVSV